MKKIFSTIFIILFAISCGCDEEVVNFDLTNQEKTIVPYQLNDAVKWRDHNNLISNGIVSEVVDRYNYGHEDCKTINYNIIVHYIKFDNFSYTIALDKRNNINTDLSIKEYDSNNAIKSFIKYSIKLDDFKTISFNSETYQNAVLIEQDILNGKPFGHLVYSKTNGIEFILFEDGTWYKRVE